MQKEFYQGSQQCRRRAGEEAFPEVEAGIGSGQPIRYRRQSYHENSREKEKVSVIIKYEESACTDKGQQIDQAVIHRAEAAEQKSAEYYPQWYGKDPLK